MENLRAIALMVCSMAGFAIGDGAIKGASTELSSAAIIFILGAGGSIMFGAILIVRGEALLTRALLHPAVITRNLAEILATAAFITALSLVPLATALAILQSTPLMVALGAVFVLKEAIGWRRWLAIFVGFVGVIVILRPGMDGFSASALLAVLAAIALSARDLASRVVPSGISTLQITFWGFLALVLSGGAQIGLTGEAWQIPDQRAMLLLAVAIAYAGGGVFCITAAMRIGDVGTVSPFRYTRLIFGIVIAMIFFGERPDLTTWIGAAIVVGSGLFVLLRERAVNLDSRE